jgi:hypothetical protein
MPGERANLVRLTKQAVEAVDTVFRALAARLTVYTRTFGPLTRETLPRFRLGVRRILAPIFGLTQTASQTAALFTTISGALAPAFDAPFRQVFTRLRSVVQRRDPGLWDMLDRKLLLGPDSDRMSLAYRLLYGPQVDKARLRRALGFDPNRVWVKGDGTPYRLSDRVWATGRDVRRAIDDRIQLALRNGEDALSLAKDLDRYVNPDYAPVKYLKDGRIVRRNMTLAPDRGGWGGTRSRALARTEISRAHAQATVEAAKDTLGVTGLQYSLSGRHPRTDRCDDLARADNYGLGNGVYPVDQAPRTPQHPQCLCLLSPVTASREDTINMIIAKYGGI